MEDPGVWVMTGTNKKSHSPAAFFCIFFKIPPNNKSGGQLLAPTHPFQTVVFKGRQVTVRNFVPRTMAQAIVWWSLSFLQLRPMPAHSAWQLKRSMQHENQICRADLIRAIPNLFLRTGQIWFPLSSCTPKNSK